MDYLPPGATQPDADYTALSSDETIVIAGPAATTITLPNAATAGAGKWYVVKRVGSGATTISVGQAVDSMAVRLVLARAVGRGRFRVLGTVGIPLAGRPRTPRPSTSRPSPR